MPDQAAPSASTAGGPQLAGAGPAGLSVLPSRQVTRTPGAVVGSYISDINRQDWAAAWRLGGDNISGALGETYAQFKAGFSQTAHVKIQSLSVAGDVVHVTTQAREKTGPCRPTPSPMSSSVASSSAASSAC